MRMLDTLETILCRYRVRNFQSCDIRVLSYVRVGGPNGYRQADSWKMTRTGSPIKSCRRVGRVVNERSGWRWLRKGNDIGGSVKSRGKMGKPPEKIQDFDDILEHVGSWNRYEQSTGDNLRCSS